MKRWHRNASGAVLLHGPEQIILLQILLVIFHDYQKLQERDTLDPHKLSITYNSWQTSGLRKNAFQGTHKHLPTCLASSFLFLTWTVQFSQNLRLPVNHCFPKVTLFRCLQTYKCSGVKRLSSWRMLIINQVVFHWHNWKKKQQGEATKDLYFKPLVVIIVINIVPKIATIASCYQKTSDLPRALWNLSFPPIKIKLLSKTHKVIRNCWHFF